MKYNNSAFEAIINENDDDAAAFYEIIGTEKGFVAGFIVERVMDLCYDWQ